MYSNPPDFTSGNGGAAWAKFMPLIGDDMLVQSQWPTIVKRFHGNVKRVVPSFFASDPATGKCYGGDTIGSIPAAFRKYAHKADNVPDTNVWGEISSDALAFVLCVAAQPAVARKAAAWRTNVAHGQLRMPMDVLKWMLALTAFPLLGAVGTVGAPRSDAKLELVAKYLDMPATTILPFWKSSTTIAESPRDVGWFTITKLGDPVPKPPSSSPLPPTTRPGQTPASSAPPAAVPPPPAGNAPATGSSSSMLPFLLIAGVGAWLLLK